MSKTKLHQDVEKLRDDIERVRDEISWLEGAPVPPEEFKARVTDGCRAMASRFDADSRLRYLAHPNGAALENLFFISAVAHIKHEASSGSVEVRDIGPMLAWTLGDSLVERLHAHIDAMDYRPGPPMAERPARLSALNAEQHELEVKEEALICKGEEAGIFIARRPDADPAVVLGYDPDGDLVEGPRSFGAPRGPAVANAVPDRAPAAASAPAPAYAARTVPAMGQAASLPGHEAMRHHAHRRGR